MDALLLTILLLHEPTTDADGFLLRDLAACHATLASESGSSERTLPASSPQGGSVHELDVDAWRSADERLEVSAWCEDETGNTGPVAVHVVDFTRPRPADSSTLAMLKSCFGRRVEEERCWRADLQPGGAVIDSADLAALKRAFGAS
jgi:hypothetical protein